MEQEIIKKKRKNLILITMVTVILCCTGIIVIFINWNFQQEKQVSSNETTEIDEKDEYISQTYNELYNLILSGYESEYELINQMDLIVNKSSDKEKQETALFLEIQVLTENGHYEKSEELLNTIKETKAELAESCKFFTHSNLLYYMWGKTDLQQYYSQKAKEKCTETN